MYMKIHSNDTLKYSYGYDKFIILNILVSWVKPATFNQRGLFNGNHFQNPLIYNLPARSSLNSWVTNTSTQIEYSCQALDQEMAYLMLGTDGLPWPMQIYWQLDTWEQT